MHYVCRIIKKENKREKTNKRTREKTNERHRRVIKYRCYYIAFITRGSLRATFRRRRAYIRKDQSEDSICRVERTNQKTAFVGSTFERTNQKTAFVGSTIRPIRRQHSSGWKDQSEDSIRRVIRKDQSEDSIRKVERTNQKTAFVGSKGPIRRQHSSGLQSLVRRCVNISWNLDAISDIYRIFRDGYPI